MSHRCFNVCWVNISHLFQYKKYGRYNFIMNSKSDRAKFKEKIIIESYTLQGRLIKVNRYLIICYHINRFIKYKYNHSHCLICDCEYL